MKTVVRISIALAFLILASTVQARPPQQPRPQVADVQAAYLFRFSKFVTWPDGPGPFSICVIGRDPFGPKLDSTVAGENVEGRSVVARRITKSQDALGCRILFIS